MASEAQALVAGYLHELAQSYIQSARSDGAADRAWRERAYALVDFSDFILTRKSHDRRPEVLVNLVRYNGEKEFAPGPSLRGAITEIGLEPSRDYNVLFVELLMAALEDAGQSMSQVLAYDVPNAHANGHRDHPT